MKVEQIVHTNLIKASAVDGENKTVCSVLRGFLLRAGADRFFYLLCVERWLGVLGVCLVPSKVDGLLI